MASYNNNNNNAYQQQSTQKVFKSSAVIVPQPSNTSTSSSQFQQNQTHQTQSSYDQNQFLNQSGPIQFSNQNQFANQSYNQNQNQPGQIHSSNQSQWTSQAHTSQASNQVFNQATSQNQNQNQSHQSRTTIPSQSPNQNQSYQSTYQSQASFPNQYQQQQQTHPVTHQSQATFQPTSTAFNQNQNITSQHTNMATMTMQQQHGAPPKVANKPSSGMGVAGQSQQQFVQYANQNQDFMQHQQNLQQSHQQTSNQQQFTSSHQFNQQYGAQNQQQNQTQQYGAQSQNQQQLRGQQIHPSPVSQQRPSAQQPQQQPYSNGGAARPGAGASGPGGAPGFLQKKHFVANQSNVEWKNLSMRKVERSNSNANANQVDSDEDGFLPEFTSRIHDLIDLREGDRAHFDCCLTPQLVGDSTLKVVWTKDGHPLPTDNRYIVQESFGRLSLDIIGVKVDDQGTYRVLVSNNQGDAASEGTLKVLAARGFTSSAGGAQQDEGSSRFIPEMIHEDQSTQMPAFMETLPPTIVIEEGEPLRLQASLQPANDPLMKVHWTFNGRPLLMGSRMATFYDFGLVTLSILDINQRDSGVYMCTARNSLGQTETRCELTCQAKGKSTVKPMFQEPLVATPAGELNEGDYVHLETRIEPRNDPYVIIEWYHNNRLIQTGQRLRPHFDFGIATLDIVGAYAEDSGTFTVKATNSLGTDTTKVDIRVAGKPGLLLDTQHPEGLAKIAELEYKDFSREFTYNDYSKHEPRFSEQLPRLPDFNEGEKLRLEAQVEPRGDPNMKVEWFLNGRPINNGHRTRTVFDFGFASLDVLDIQTRDAGEYVIRATNTLGTAESKTFLKVIGRGGVVSDAQYAASLDKIRDLESYENGPSFIPDNIQDEMPASAPIFTEPLQPVPELREGQSVHLECTISPPNDPTLKVEWFVNGRPLHSGSRFRTFNDFGAIGLDVLTVIPEDTGEYVVKCSNAMGSNTSSTFIQVKARASIILESQAPGGADKIRELEDMLNYKPQTHDEEVVHQAPVFIKQLIGPAGKVKEGQSIHLECQIHPVNDPSLRVEWFFNGRPLATGSRCRFTHDLEYVALDMLYVFPRDAGEYSVKVTNSAGSAMSATTVHCFDKKNVITESLNPRALKRIQDLEAWNL